MSWCGENICERIRREYVILNSTNGALFEVFPSGRIAPPLVAPLPSGELLLGKDNICVFVDQNGKLLQEGRICWSEAPTSIIVENPYAIGLMPRHIEIQSLCDPYPLIQIVVLRNVRRLLQSTHVIIVALENYIYGLFPVPIGMQIVQLTASGKFEGALTLCKLLPPEDSKLRAAKEQSIHIRYAHYLYENWSYEKAMEHFLASQVEITYVLSLYPSIVLPKSSVISLPEKYMVVSGDVQDLLRGSSGISDDMVFTHPHTLDSEESVDIESRKISHNTLMALIKLLQRKIYVAVEKAAAEGTEEAVSDAVGNNFVSYGNSRPKKQNKGRANAYISSVARDTAAILDTALLHALLLTGQHSSALELLKDLNYCDLRICEEFMQGKNQFVCLLELYKCNAMHREALNLLQKLVGMEYDDTIEFHVK